ncbi:hypothetical protein CSB45_00440 [candidate division KSB3 bacterium]|uniref:site-specific DNA-methyltransferase (adenine-specific) n=1 Tax=candidate division KSB3 bacterium TaxID=2044937 RepID=A0A2G6EET0_9BACT|nr:MAG: hypothetical protein CSB45_00440 [candidate division KSB3 bacterium]
MSGSGEGWQCAQSTAKAAHVLCCRQTVMPNHLHALVKECRWLLELDMQDRCCEGGTEAVTQAALACFLDLAAIRCFEEQLWRVPSAMSAELSPELRYQRLLDARKRLQIDLSCLPKELLLDAPVPSPSAFEKLARYFTADISSEEWQSEHILGWLYQYFDDDALAQKQAGRFYTPEALAEYIVSESLSRWHPGDSDLESSSGPILDLACGAGIFALKVFDTLYRRGKGPAQARQILEERLFLVDRDPWACHVAALNLYLKAKSLEADCQPCRINVFCADALLRWESDENDELRRLFSTRFNFVLGNPPYIVINQLKADKNVMQHYKSYASAAFKINTFALFIERGLELLRPSGKLGMIVPNTLLTQVYFEPLRRYILDTARISKIFDTKRLFENAFVENCIILLQREDDADRRRRTRTDCVLNSASRRPSGRLEFCEQRVRIPQRHFEKAPFLMFNVHLDEPGRALLEKIADSCRTLGDICESHDGVNPGNAKHKMLVRKKLDSCCRKVLNGKNIGRYHLRWDGLYVRYDRRLLSVRDNVRWGHRAALDSPKILTRQTADRIIGTCDDGRYYATNSIHTTILKESARNDMHLKYVLALLNSKVLSFFYRKLIAESGQLFSQVKLVHLRRLPLKSIPWQDQQSIVDEVDTLLALNQHLHHSAESEDRDALQAQISTHETRLEKKVFALYCLDPEEIRLIDAEFPH